MANTVTLMFFFSFVFILFVLLFLYLYSLFYGEIKIKKKPLFLIFTNLLITLSSL